MMDIDRALHFHGLACDRQLLRLSWLHYDRHCAFALVPSYVP
jgi:hypothetical protein